MAQGRKGTRDPELAPTQVNDLIRVLKLGMTVRDACTFAGVSKTTFYKWVRIGARRPEGDPVRAFADAVAKGKTSAKVYAVGQVTVGMKKDWKAAAWMLGVQYPREFGPKVRVTLDQEFGNAISNLEEDFADTPDLLAKVLASLTREPRGRGDAALGPAEPEDSPGTDPEPT